MNNHFEIPVTFSLMISFIFFVGTGFWLILLGEPIPAYSGIILINLWFFGVLMIRLSGGIRNDSTDDPFYSREKPGDHSSRQTSFF